MTATTPEQTVQLVGERISASDVDGAIALYEEDAAFAPQPGQVVHGVQAIRQALERFAALKPRLEGTIERVVQTDELALVLNRWTLEGTTPAGEPVEMAGVSADVVRRQRDGSWRVLIDDPWGGAPRGR